MHLQSVWMSKQASSDMCTLSPLCPNRRVFARCVLVELISLTPNESAVHFALLPGSMERVGFDTDFRLDMGTFFQQVPEDV